MLSLLCIKLHLLHGLIDPLVLTAMQQTTLLNIPSIALLYQPSGASPVHQEAVP